MKTYTVTLTHDNGTVKIKVVAINEQSAKEQVMSAENCPESAIVKVKENIKRKQSMFDRVNSFPVDYFEL
jgi:hypothetical protein